MEFPADATVRELTAFLKGKGPDRELMEASRRVLNSRVGSSVYLRGIVEISNQCRKNCFYCGLRRDNSAVRRYTIPFETVVRALKTGYARGLRSFLLQSGELPGDEHLDLVERILLWVKENLPGTSMVLSLGELPPGTCDRLREAGAKRFLLRIEVSSPELYGRFHPADGSHSHGRRRKALEYLRDSGWQAGSGVLIGLPGQKPRDLAQDLLWLRDMDVDMIGMGPYIENSQTPLWKQRHLLPSKEDRILMTLRMIALARLLMPRVNIAATTALQTIHPRGLEKGLQAGANVVMPNLTPAVYRREYNLYSGKTAVEDSLEEILEELTERCRSVGRKVVLNHPGDPLHYMDRMKGADPT